MAAEPMDQLITGIYDAALDASLWPAVLETIGHELGAERGLLVWSDVSAPEVGIEAEWNINPIARTRWIEEFLDRDLWMQRLSQRPSGVVTTGAAILDPDEFHRSDIYRAILAPDRIEDLLGGLLTGREAERSGVMLYRRTLFQLEEVRSLARLVPHLQRARQVQSQLLLSAARQVATAAALDALATAVILVDDVGQIFFANRAAEDLLGRADGLTSRAGRLRAHHPEDAARLEAAIAGARLARQGRGAAGAAVDLRRPSLLRPLHALVAPVRRREDGPPPLLPEAPLPRTLVLLLVSDPEEESRPEPERLRALFGLTPAEARLAAALAAGASLERYAEEQGLRPSTVRTSLKRVFEKTGTRRQAELVRLLARSAAAQTRE